MMPEAITYKDNLYYSADEMNRLVTRHNTIVEGLLVEWARMFTLFNHHWRLDRKKGEDYDKLMEQYNSLLHDCQLTKMLEDENSYLWQVNLDLHKIIEETRSESDL